MHTPREPDHEPGSGSLDPDVKIKNLADVEAHIAHLRSRLDIAEKQLSDHVQRFDTLQTPLWKRVWYRIDGWPGQRDLNAPGRSWRPWH